MLLNLYLENSLKNYIFVLYKFNKNMNDFKKLYLMMYACGSLYWMSRFHEPAPYIYRKINNVEYVIGI